MLSWFAPRFLNFSSTFWIFKRKVSSFWTDLLLDANETFYIMWFNGANKKFKWCIVRYYILCSSVGVDPCNYRILFRASTLSEIVWSVRELNKTVICREKNNNMPLKLANDRTRYLSLKLMTVFVLAKKAVVLYKKLLVFWEISRKSITSHIAERKEVER